MFSVVDVEIRYESLTIEASRLTSRDQHCTADKRENGTYGIKD